MTPKPKVVRPPPCPRQCNIDIDRRKRRHRQADCDSQTPSEPLANQAVPTDALALDEIALAVIRHAAIGLGHAPLGALADFDDRRVDQRHGSGLDRVIG